MGEVTASGSSHQIRAIFAVLLQFCQPTDPCRLYDKFKNDMSEDFVYSKIKNGEFTRSEVDMKCIYNQVLISIDDQLGQMGGSLSSFEEMPQPVELTPQEKLARTFAEEYFDTNI